VSRQIAVRLSDDLVEFVDPIVETGEQRSHAAVVTRALERELSRRIAARDAEILAASGPDADLASWPNTPLTRPWTLNETDPSSAPG
jgi:Arc/MetJ-type ribon-helix-helix transcriptional regulator